MRQSDKISYLQETDLGGSFAEALSADIESVLADDCVSVSANTAKAEIKDEGQLCLCIPLTASSTVVLWVSVPQVCHID